PRLRRLHLGRLAASPSGRRALQRNRPDRSRWSQTRRRDASLARPGGAPDPGDRGQGRRVPAPGDAQDDARARAARLPLRPALVDPGRSGTAWPVTSFLESLGLALSRALEPLRAALENAGAFENLLIGFGWNASVSPASMASIQAGFALDALFTAVETAVEDLES